MKNIFNKNLLKKTKQNIYNFNNIILLIADLKIVIKNFLNKINIIKA